MKDELSRFLLMCAAVAATMWSGMLAAGYTSAGDVCYPQQELFDDGDMPEMEVLSFDSAVGGATLSTVSPNRPGQAAPSEKEAMESDIAVINDVKDVRFSYQPKPVKQAHIPAAKMDDIAEMLDEIAAKEELPPEPAPQQTAVTGIRSAAPAPEPAAARAAIEIPVADSAPSAPLLALNTAPAVPARSFGSKNISLPPAENKQPETQATLPAKNSDEDVLAAIKPTSIYGQRLVLQSGSGVKGELEPVAAPAVSPVVAQNAVFVDGVMRFVVGTSPKLCCSPNVFTDIEFQQGEKIKEVALSDKDRWAVRQLPSRVPHLIVRPADNTDVPASMVVTTDARVYYFHLISNKQNPAMDRIGFVYPANADREPVPSVASTWDAAVSAYNENQRVFHVFMFAVLASILVYLYRTLHRIPVKN